MQKVLHLGVDGLYFDMDVLSARETAKLKRLELFSGVTVEPKNNKQLLALRKKIDTLDDAILNLLSERIKTVETLAGIKKNSRMKIVQAARWKEVVTLALDHARKKGIDEDALLNILEAIHLNAIRVQGKKYQKD